MAKQALSSISHVSMSCQYGQHWADPATPSLKQTVLKGGMCIWLAGFSDPVYAEACVTVHQYDIVLDVTVTNRTADTLQNLNLELATMGDLKLVERPQNYALRPHGQQKHQVQPEGFPSA